MKYGFIGCGNMGGAVAKALSNSTKDIAISDRSGRGKALAEQLGITYSDNASIAANCDRVFLAVKPYFMEAVLKAIQPQLAEKKPLRGAHIYVDGFSSFTEQEYEILDVHAIEILDSRANPTLEVTVTLKDGFCGSAAVPSGASTGQYEAHELRDADKRHMGNGVEQAVTNVNTRIADKLIGMNVLEQAKIDDLLIKADGTDNKRKYGANASPDG